MHRNLWVSTMRMRKAVTETMKAATEITVVMMKMVRINHPLRS